MQLLGDGAHLAMVLVSFHFRKEHNTALLGMTEDNYDY